MKKLTSLVLSLTLAAAPLAAVAHSGGTNAEGCHNEKATGGYHCHGGSGGNSGGGSVTTNGTGKLPSCPKGEHYSINKSTCVCKAMLEKDSSGTCVCKKGYVSDGAESCKKLPLKTISKVKKAVSSSSAKSVKVSSKSSAKSVNPSLKSSTKSKAALVPSTSCTIKGNISATKEKIFHALGCPNYKQTVIDATKGERMFCSEQEAKDAGWRKALNCP